jgi:hypothetical protein
LRGSEKDGNPSSTKYVDKERGDSLEGRTNRVNDGKLENHKNMLEPRGLEVFEPTKRLMPYVEVPPLRTRPIPGGKVLVPEKAPVKTLAPRDAKAMKQARKELISGILKEIFSIPHPMKFEDLALVSPMARQEAIDLLKQGKWGRSKSGGMDSLRGALMQELEDTMLELGQGSTLFVTTLGEIMAQTESVNTEGSETTNVVPPEEPTGSTPETPQKEVALMEVLLQDLPALGSFEADGTGNVPQGGLVIPDAVEIYLAEHQGVEVNGLVTATDSEKIRVFYPTVNNARREECIFDEGSQVCSASEAAAKNLGISWDPDVTIGLQSSNRTTARTLGLARNVPIRCGDGVTAYVQLHIVRDAAYKLLLGRPFLSVMSAQSHNHTDGSHKMTLSDPNTGRRVVVPSFARGEIPVAWKDELNTSFQASRI